MAKKMKPPPSILRLLFILLALSFFLFGTVIHEKSQRKPCGKFSNISCPEGMTCLYKNRYEGACVNK
jgi:hypothetical protein